MKKKTRKPAVQTIAASRILQAEAERLNMLKKAMPKKAEPMIKAQVWAFSMCAAYLDSLGAPERLVRYLPAPHNKRGSSS